MAFFHPLYNNARSCYTILMNFLRRLKKRFIKFPLRRYLTQTGYATTQDALRQSKVGDPLQIVRLDDDCAYVYSVELNALIGKIDSQTTKRLSGVFGKRFCLDGTLAVKTGGLPYKFYGGAVDVYDSATFMSNVEDFERLRN